MLKPPSRDWYKACTRRDVDEAHSRGDRLEADAHALQHCADARYAVHREDGASGVESVDWALSSCAPSGRVEPGDCRQSAGVF